MNLRIRNTCSRAPGALITAALAASIFMAVGCTDDEANMVGNTLIGPQVDTLLVPLNVNLLTDFGDLAIEDEDVPFEENETLYFGSQGTESSSILLRYDFAALRAEMADSPPDFSAENIVSVKLRLYFTNALGTPIKSFGLYELIDPLDPALYPGPPPEAEDSPLAEELEATTDITQTVTLPTDRFIEWWEAEDHNGLLLTEQPNPENIDGFVAIASKENRHGASQFDGDFHEDTALGPALIVELITMPDTTSEAQTIRLLPADDVATMEVLDPLPAGFTDRFTLRTHLRSYPYMSFDLDDLPENVLINRAELWVGLDTLTSYGPLESIVVTEVDGGFFDTAGGAATLDDLCDAAMVTDGHASVDAQAGENHRLRFNVTRTCQRFVNGLFDRSPGFLLAAGEDCFSAYDMSSIDPDFYMNRFNFYGTAAADSMRPHLKILYTVEDDLSGGAR